MKKYIKLVLAVGIIFGIVDIILLTQPPPPTVKINPLREPTPYETLSETKNQSQRLLLITVIAVGDIMPGRSVNAQLRSRGDFTASFKETAALLQTADLTIANLEGPLVKNCPTTNQGMKFCGDSRFIEGLIFAGIDVLSLANNHSLDYGPEGLEQTVTLLEKQGILPLLNGASRITEKNGMKIGLLARNLVYINDYNIDRYRQELVKEVKQLEPTVEVTIVSLHWGDEYRPTPQAWQKQLAHDLIEAGADLILGHHSHVTQPTEIYQDKLIIYSMGNFVFDQMWSEAIRRSAIYHLEMTPNSTKLLKQTPVLIQDYFQPVIIH